MALIVPLAAAGCGFRSKGAGGRELPRHQTHHSEEGQREPTVGVPAGAAEGPQASAGAEPGPAEGLPGNAVHHGLDG